MLEAQCFISTKSVVLFMHSYFFYLFSEEDTISSGSGSSVNGLSKKARSKRGTYISCFSAVFCLFTHLSLQASVIHNVHTSSPLKPHDQSKPNFMWSLLGKGDQKFI